MIPALYYNARFLKSCRIGSLHLQPSSLGVLEYRSNPWGFESKVLTNFYKPFSLRLYSYHSESRIIIISYLQSIELKLYFLIYFDEHIELLIILQQKLSHRRNVEPYCDLKKYVNYLYKIPSRRLDAKKNAKINQDVALWFEYNFPTTIIPQYWVFDLYVMVGSGIHNLKSLGYCSPIPVNSYELNKLKYHTNLSWHIPSIQINLKMRVLFLVILVYFYYERKMFQFPKWSGSVQKSLQKWCRFFVISDLLGVDLLSFHFFR